MVIIKILSKSITSGATSEDHEIGDAAAPGVVTRPEQTG
jgi:hypothetical protein